MLCLSLTGSTLTRNLELLDRYRSMVDVVELRVDFLEPQEQFYVRRFPSLAGLPVILTVRRKTDGGQFTGGEAVRLVVMAKALAYADADHNKNFAYIDLETDLKVPSLQEAARTFGTKVIRSRHIFEGMPSDINAVWRELTENPQELPKLSVFSKKLEDTLKLYEFFRKRPKGEARIVSAMGDYGFSSRILTPLTGSILTYSSALEAGMTISAPGQMDPRLLVDIYRYRQIKPDWLIYGILGGAAVCNSLSPLIHNAGFAALDIPAVYSPFPADNLDCFMRLAEFLPLQGFSVTVPYKEKICAYLATRSVEVDSIGACNTMVRTDDGWAGYNTDAHGFKQALLAFYGQAEWSDVRACIVGAGGAARAVAHVLAGLGVRACVINRNMHKAKQLAEQYGFSWSGLTERAVHLMEKYNDLIIQTTSVGMTGGPTGDPMEWYDFRGHEALFETIYNPLETPVMARARAAGCRAVNGLGMLKAQAAAQFALFTGCEYPDILPDFVAT